MENESTFKIDKLLDASQWSIWKFQMRILLSASDLLETASGVAEKPTDAAKLVAWQKSDVLAQKQIISTIGQQPMLHIINCESSNAMWNKLHSVYEQKSESGIHMLQQRFYSFSKNPGDSMACHISKLEKIVQQLKDLGEPISDSMVITKVLMTLPPSFNFFHSAWESTDKSERTLDNLISRLMIEETRMLSQEEPVPSEALVANKFRRFRSNSKQESNNNKSSTKPGKCFLCNERGHWKRECPKRRSSTSKLTKFDKKTSEAFISEVMLSECVNESAWFLDSGASDHMSNKRCWFSHFEALDDAIPVRVGDGNIIYAHGRGIINILAFDGNQWNEKQLKDVLFVPEIRLNLFSAGCVLDKGFDCISNKDQCELRMGDRTVAVGVRKAKFFEMMFKVILGKTCEEEKVGGLFSDDGKEVCDANIASRLSLRLWHERLGHQSVAHVRNFLEAAKIEYEDEDNFLCEGCIFGKQHRAVFSRSESKATKCGEIVHADVCGPMQETSLGGSRYFLLFKDDFSHFRTVYFLQQKSEVTKYFGQFLQSVRNKTGHNSDILRSDNGLEFLNKSMEEILQKEGIRHQRSAPYSPQQNGRAERDMRTIVEAGRALIFSCHIGLKFWAEAVSTAVYVLNRTGKSSVVGKSPFEIWFNAIPKLDHLRIFGSEVYVHVPKERRQKWDSKSEKCVFVGYSENVKAYRVWSPTQNRIKVSRDVIFKESVEDPRNPQVTVKTTNPIEKHDIVSDDCELKKETSDFTPASTSHKIQDERETQANSEGDNAEKDNAEDKNRYKEKLRKLDPVSYVYSSDCFSFMAGSLEPISFEDAVNSNQKAKWIEAMDDKFKSLIQNQTWILVDLPENKKVIDNRWVYKIKYKSDGTVDRYKMV